MKSLVIVESPTKAKTIGKYLGSDYLIKASMGHIMDLPKSTLGVDVEKDFFPQYEVVDAKKKTIAELKSAAKEAQNIILATDPDREGEAIAAHVAELLQKTEDRKQKTDSRKTEKTEKLKRIVFHEITKEAVEEALKNPRSIDTNLVEAQTARRVLDRLVGYKLSPLLWRKVRIGLSAGRVQSVALRLIVEREREIGKFRKENYWSITVLLSNESNKTNETNFELIEINGEKIEEQEKFDLYDGEYRITKTIIDNQKKADEIVNDLKTKEFIVSDVSKKEIRRSPQAPYTTSTLQQDASRRLGFTSKRTMRTAQNLYEEGLITYHRTDSVVISQSAINAIRNFAKQEYGEKYITPQPRFYKTKQKLAQEAHEGIRPTRIQPVLSIKNQVLSAGGNDGWRLYELIWRRAVASQMSDAVIELTTVVVDAFGAGHLPHISNDAQRALSKNSTFDPSSLSESRQSEQSSSSKDKSLPTFSSFESGQASSADYTFKTTGSILMFEGFLKVNPQALEDKRLPNFKTQEKLDYVSSASEKHETNPPPRYNDASLIKTLEEKGIGRPSTYASIISTIEDRKYVERAENRFAPTVIGFAVNDFLVKNFSDIDDIPFTAEMEDHLDEIADGKRDWVPMIREFYKPFSKKLDDAKDVERVKIEVEETDEKCPKCSSNLVIRMGRFGKFLSCSKFPDCDFKKAFTQETGFTCPKCGGLPAGRQGKIIARRTRKGRAFFGCSNYPKCNFAVWKLDDLKNPEIVKQKLLESNEVKKKKDSSSASIH